VATGLYPVGIAVAENPSSSTTPNDPRPYLVFGSAAAAVVLGPGRPSEGVLGVSLGNRGSLAEATVLLSHPRFSGHIETVRFGTSNEDMSHIALDRIIESTRAVLTQAGVEIGNVEWLLPHQPNGTMLESIVKTLGVDPARVVPIVHEIGSVAAASIPVSLDRLMRTRPVRAGDKILMVGVGTGVSYGAILYQIAP
jgi:3-oxoacyl-[acyl-carrier-protein] synthase III